MKSTFPRLRGASLAGVLLVLGSAGASIAATPTPGVTYGDNAAAGSTFLFDGARFYYESYGSGPPLLLIHGNGESIGSFKGQIAPLARRYRVIAMDSRGQGKSSLGDAPLTYEQMADDTNAFLEHVKLAHVKVLGWSDGGIIGLLLTLHHPDKVSMLAVMGANLEPDGAYPWAVDGIKKTRAKLEAALAQSTEAQRQQMQLELKLLDLLGNQPHIPAADLAGVQIPTLVMAGDRDVIRDEHTLMIFHALPKSQLAIFPGATHMIPSADPARFNRTVLEFFGKPFSMPDTKDLGWFD